MGIIQKIAEGLRKTKDFFLGRLQKILNSFTVIDDELFDQLEETMIMSDIGVETSEEICSRLRKKIKERGITDPQMIMELIQEINRNGTTVVISTHAKDIVDRMQKRVVAINKGVILRDVEGGGYNDETSDLEILY